MGTTRKETPAPPNPVDPPPQDPQTSEPEARTSAWRDPDPNPHTKSELRRVILRH